MVACGSPTGSFTSITTTTWANARGNAIGRANLDGTNVNEHFIAGADQTQAVAVDSDHVYWADSTCCGRATSIGRGNLDGTGVNESRITDPNLPFGMAVDSQHVYWTDFASGTIARANLIGTHVSQRFITGGRDPGAIAVK